LGLDGVTFYGRQDDVYRFLRRSDILVIPGLEETFPMAGIEGLFAGQAVLASRCGGLPEMIQHGETGWLFEPGDVAALARGLLRLMVDRELRLRLAVAGQQRAKAYFRLERMCMDLEAVYASLVGDVAT
ncbi:MAG TPA: glycosyltransferase family 4 protein, partial [Bacillota bacterium]